MSRRDLGIGITLGLLAGVIALVLFLFLESGDKVDAPSVAGDGNGSTTQQPGNGDSGDGQAPKPEVQTIKVVGLRPVEVARINVSQGDTVRFRITSDTAMTIVVQGYNVTKPIPAGTPTLVSFPARRAGDFGVFVSGEAFALATIKVSP